MVLTYKEYGNCILCNVCDYTLIIKFYTINMSRPTQARKKLPYPPLVSWTFTGSVFWFSKKRIISIFFPHLLTYLQSAQGPPQVLAWHSTRGRRACPWWMRPQTRQLRSGWSSLARWRWHWPPTSARGGGDGRSLSPTTGRRSKGSRRKALLIEEQWGKSLLLSVSIIRSHHSLG